MNGSNSDLLASPVCEDFAIPLTEATQRIAKRLVWFEPAELALKEPVRFLAYAFAHARDCDMHVLRAVLSDAQLRFALKNAPPGIIDEKSWAYWHLMLDMGDAPSLPTRHLPA